MNFNTVLISSLLLAAPVAAQDYNSQQPYPAQQGQYQQPQQQRLAPEQLDDLVAPIALYPDALLSQVLVASSYPDQLSDANQWLGQNGGLQGQSRIETAQQQNWDPSVQALVAFPDVVTRMSQDMRWTEELGNAFVNQQADVMSAVQRMRQRARQSGKLQSTPQQIVNYDVQGGEPIVEIQSADPEVVYVPTYNPEYIWGAPAYGYYPSLYYPSFGFGFGRGISIGAFFGGWGGGRSEWGWGPRWHERTVVVNNGFFDRYRFSGYGGGGYRSGRYGGTSVWSHDDRFRGGQVGARSFSGGGYNRGSFERTGVQQYQSRQQQQGFSGNSGNYNGRGSQRTVTPQVQQQSAPRNFTGNYGGGSYNGGFSRGSQTPVQQRAVMPQVQQPTTQPRSFTGNYGGGSYNGGFSRGSQAPVQQTIPQSRSFSQAPVQQFQQQRQQSQSAPRSYGGGNFSRTERQQFSQPQQQQHNNAPAQQGGGFGRNEGGGHRR